MNISKDNKKEVKPNYPKSEIKITDLRKIDPYFLKPKIEIKFSDEGSSLKWKDVLPLFKLEKLKKLKPLKIMKIFSSYQLPEDIIISLIYERRREQKLSKRKHRDEKEKVDDLILDCILEKLERSKRELSRQKAQLKREIEELRAKCYQLEISQPNPTGYSYPTIQNIIYPDPYIQQYVDPIAQLPIHQAYHQQYPTLHAPADNQYYCDYSNN